MKRFVKLLPALYLLLSLDVLAPEPAFPPAWTRVGSWNAAAPLLPGFNEGRSGEPGEPLSLIVVGTRDSVRRALSAAGWIETPTSLRAALAAGLVEFLGGGPVASFPPSRLHRLKGRRPSMNWVMPARSIQERHRFHLWRTGITDLRGRDLWWGTGNKDRLGERTLDTDAERDFIASTMANSPGLNALVILPAPRVPREGVTDRDIPYRTDGRVAVIDLR